MSLDPVLVLALRGSLALLLASAAAHKVRDRGSFVAVLREYRVAPSRAAAALGVCVVAAEAATAAALVWPGWGRLGAAAAAALLGLYSGAIALNLARGRRDIDCGCFGPAGGQTLSGALLLRNAVLVVAACVAAAPASARALVWLDVVTAACAVSALAFLWTSASHLLALAPHLRRLRWRPV